jgi:GWxTD domain-containing protein
MKDMNSFRRRNIVLLFFSLALNTMAGKGIEQTCLTHHVLEFQFIKNLSDSLFNKGLDALKAKDTITAEQYFKASIIENDNAPAHVEIAKIYLNRNDYNSRDLAFDNFKSAVLADPTNVRYKFFYADMCKDISRISAYEQYNEILMLDSNQVDAWLNLAIMKDEDFAEYNRAAQNVDEFMGSFQYSGDKDFCEAEKYYKHVLVLDALNYAALFKLAMLYERASQYEKGIPLLKKVIDQNKGEKDTYLALGLLQYKAKQFKDCFDAYKRALELMDENEKEDFVFNSIEILLQPVIKKGQKVISDYELSEIIEQFWKISEPTSLTNDDKELLDHYSRVAFADLHFSVPQINIIGWKSDRGETVLRYGELLSLTCFKPQKNESEVLPKINAWDYRDITFGFPDKTSAGNYQFTTAADDKDKSQSQLNGEAQFYAEYLRNAHFETLEPKNEWPTFNVGYNISQFKSGIRRNHTDIYISYAMDPVDSLIRNEELFDPHLAAFFLFNSYKEELLEKQENVNSIGMQSILNPGKNRKVYPNVIGVSSPVDSGSYSLEILRGRDKNVSSNRNRFNVKKYGNFNLQISDLLVAAKIVKDKTNKCSINRGMLNILPNPVNMVSAGNPLYIYYELYNLKTNKDHVTEFEQSVDVTEYNSSIRNGLEKTVGNVLDFFGFDNEEKIGFTNSYHSKEENQQLYFKLDLTGAKPGKYIITITVTDKIAHSTASGSTIVNWLN